MDFKNELKELENRTKIVSQTIEECSWIESNIGYVEGSSGNISHTMTEYQKDFIYALNNPNFRYIYFIKHRCAGFTTTYAAHLAHELQTKEGTSYLIICPNVKMCDELKGILLRDIGMCVIKRDRKRVVFATPNTCIEKAISRRFDECFMDESAYIPNFKEIFWHLNCCLTPNGKIVCVATRGNANNTFERFINESDEEGNVYKQNVYWWENPGLNKNLKWVKVEPELTIDNEGNIVVNKEKFLEKIKDGWMPKAPKMDALKQLLGDKQEIEYFDI